MFKEHKQILETEIIFYKDLTCDGCNKAFGHAFPLNSDKSLSNVLQADEGLTLKLSGNYPQLYDDYNASFMLCDVCVEVLRVTFPNIKHHMEDWLSRGWQ